MSNENPLIDDDSYQTLYNVSCALCFLQTVEPKDGCEILTNDTKYGEYLLTSCIRDAIDYEKERAFKQRKAEA